MIFNPEYECMDGEARKKLQLARLKNLVEMVYERVPFYRGKMKAMGIEPRDIRCIADIDK